MTTEEATDDWEAVSSQVVTKGMDEEEATVAEVVPPRSAELNRRGSLNRMSLIVEDANGLEIKPLKRAESMNYDKDHDVHISPDQLAHSSDLLSMLQRATLDSLKLIRHDEDGETKTLEEMPPLSGPPLFDSVDSAKQLLKILKLSKKELSLAHHRTGNKEYYEQLRERAIKNNPPTLSSPFVTTRNKHSPSSPGRKSGLAVAVPTVSGPTDPGSPTVPSPKQLHSPRQPHPGRRRSSKNMRVEKEEEATVAEVVPPRAAELFRRNSFTRKAMLEGLEGAVSPTEPPPVTSFPSSLPDSPQEPPNDPAPSPQPAPTIPTAAAPVAKPSPCCEVQ